jgi:hypothetical protein
MATDFGGIRRVPRRLPASHGGPGNGSSGTANVLELLRIAILASLIGAALVSFNMGAQRWLGTRMEARLDALFTRSEFGLAPRPETLAAAQGIGPSLADIHARCERRGKRASIDSRFDSALEGPLASEQSLIRSAAYLDCVMEAQPSRFCDQSHRVDLVAKLRDHLDRMRRVRMEWQLYTLPASLGPGQSPHPIQEMSSSMLAEHDPETRAEYPSTLLDRRITEGLQELAVNGYISRADFGWFGLLLPAKLKPSFEELGPIIDRC